MTYKILVVDDEPEILNLMKIILSAVGYETVTAVDGPEAIERTIAERPHLILLDLWLPKMNGIQVMKYLQRDDRTSSIPIILVTADANYQAAAGDLVLKDVVLKPFETEEMLGKISSYLS